MATKSLHERLAHHLDLATREPKPSDNLDEAGRERPSPTPMRPPIGYKKQQSMVDLVREAVRAEHLARDLAAAGRETFEESEDFDVGEDFDPKSPYENDFDPPAAELRREIDKDKATKAAAAAAPPKTKEPVGSVPPAPSGAPTPDPKNSTDVA